jgi:L-iditol 2-dehydrogenase
VNRAVIAGPHEVSLEQVSRPARPADEVLVAVRACGLCTWEQRVYRGATRHYPFVGGHEISGVVVDAPPGPIAVGSHVAVSRLPRCGRCAACLSGRDNLCAYLSGVGDSNGPGGLAEYVVAPIRDVGLLPPTRSWLEGALVEPLACVLNSLRVAGVEQGSRLAIIGNGFMGVLHARAAEAVGAEVTLYATDPPPAGLEHAWAGAVRSLEDQRTALGERRPRLIEWEFDQAIVIRDVPVGLTVAAQLVAPGGTVSVYASRPIDEDVRVSSQIMRKKEISITGAASHRLVDFRAATSLVAHADVQVGDLVHRSYPLEEVADALDYATSHHTGRVMVTMDAPAAE